MGVVLNAPFPRRQRVANVVRNVVRYLLVGSIRGWVRNLGATAPALGSMTLLLVLSGLVGLSAYGVQRLAAAQAVDASVLHIYLSDSAKPQDVDALRTKLTRDSRVADVTYVSKADALKRSQRRPGLSELASASDGNPFPASLDVRLRSIQDVKAVATDVAGDPAVDPVLPTSYNPGANDRMQKVLAILGVAGGAFLLLLAFVAITVTANSIRAAIYSRQQEVSIMQLVGARRWMVRGPFLLEGALTGGAAGLVAALVTFAASLAAVEAGASTFSQLAPGITPGSCVVAAGLVFVGGVLLGAAASLLSVHRQLEPG